ncbi:unnamed protein product [Dicrocoelium dendriticum]|nr:unnamed protein product [Dicrocoelium dendriticum]
MMDTGEKRPMTELELLKMRMHKTTDESLESTRRMVQLCDESQKTGAATMQQLQSQGEQLREVDRNMDEIHHDLRQAEQNLEELDKCCGLCVLPWKRSKKQKSDRYFQKPPPNAHQPYYNTSVGNARTPGFPAAGNPVTPSQGPFIKRILNDERETEIETNLQQVSSMVGELKNMATDMNQEIKTHNELLERIDRKADANKDRLADAQYRAETILGRPTAKPDEGSSKFNLGLSAAKLMMK